MYSMKAKKKLPVGMDDFTKLRSSIDSATPLPKMKQM